MLSVYPDRDKLLACVFVVSLDIVSMSKTMTATQPSEPSRRASTLPPLDMTVVSCVLACRVGDTTGRDSIGGI